MNRVKSNKRIIRSGLKCGQNASGSEGSQAPHWRGLQAPAHCHALPWAPVPSKVICPFQKPPGHWVGENHWFFLSWAACTWSKDPTEYWEYLHFSKKISQNFLRFLFNFFPSCLNERQEYLRLTTPLMVWLCCMSCWMLQSRDSERHYLSLKSKNSSHFLFFYFNNSMKISASFRMD